MDNVPSSAILLIIAILTACTIGGIAMMVFYAGQNISNTGRSEQEETGRTIAAQIIEQYDGQTVKGSGVIRALAKLKDERVSVQVQRTTSSGTGRVAKNNSYHAYVYDLADTVTADLKESRLGASLNDQFQDDYKVAKFYTTAKEEGKLDDYIDPEYSYVGRVITFPSGDPVAVIFDLTDTSTKLN